MKVRGYRRIFAHTASVFFQRKIARPETGEISSLSCEECPGQEIVVTLFEIPYTPESIKASIAGKSPPRVVTAIQHLYTLLIRLLLESQPASSHKDILEIASGNVRYMEVEWWSESSMLRLACVYARFSIVIFDSTSLARSTGSMQLVPSRRDQVVELSLCSAQIIFTCKWAS